jgi:hypothetical protein
MQNIPNSDNLISEPEHGYLPIFSLFGTGQANLRDLGKLGSGFPGPCPMIRKAHFGEKSPSGDKRTKRGFAGRIIAAIAHWHT